MSRREVISIKKNHSGNIRTIKLVEFYTCERIHRSFISVTRWESRIYRFNSAIKLHREKLFHNTVWNCKCIEMRVKWQIFRISKIVPSVSIEYSSKLCDIKNLSFFSSFFFFFWSNISFNRQYMPHIFMQHI